jgi:hypothetical protein
MADDGGVLGNLPNSRPGKRSEKRTSAKPGARAAGKAGPKAAQRKRTTAVKKQGSGDRVVVDRDMRGKVRQDTFPPPATEDPVGAVVRTAAGAAATGVRVAGALSRELFKRLPRP